MAENTTNERIIGRGGERAYLLGPPGAGPQTSVRVADFDAGGAGRVYPPASLASVAKFGVWDPVEHDPALYERIKGLPGYAEKAR